MNVVIYARFSSHSQNEQSIEGQLKVCYEYAKQKGYNIISEYIDRAISGKEAENRLEFQRMINDSAKRQFEGVLVYQLDRFARNRYDSAIYKAKLKKYGVRVLSAKENISDDASGILMEAVLEGMAEYYSVELSQKIKRGLNINAEKGLAIGGMKILGYKIEDKHYVIDENTAPIVKKIFDMYISGKTMADVIRYLNQIGAKTALGNEFNKNSIRRILTNKKYIGIYTYKGVEMSGNIPRIIDDETFKHAVSRLEKNKKAPARAKAKEEIYLLSTKIFCGHCNTSIVGVSGTSRNKTIHQYYQCSNNRKKKCTLKPVKKSYIEDLVIDTVMKILTPEKIDMIAKNICELSEKESNTDTLKRLKKKLKENETATNNLIKALESGKAIDIISAQIEKRQLEKQNLEVQIAREKIMKPKLEVEHVKFFFEKFLYGDLSDINFRQSLVDTFINKVYLFEDKLCVICNAKDSKIEIPLHDTKCSYKGHMVEHIDPNTNIGFLCNGIIITVKFKKVKS